MGMWSKSKKTYFEYFEEQAQEADQAACLLERLFLEPQNRETIAKQIQDCEHRSDVITHTVLNEMNSKGFILPIDHEDIFLFTKALDDVMDYIDDSSESYNEIYQLEQSTENAQLFSNIIREGTVILVRNCHLLKQTSYHADEILKNCVRIHELENRADLLKKESLKFLFAQLRKNEVSLPDYIAWNEIYKTLEIVTDKMEDCANLAEQIVTKYS